MHFHKANFLQDRYYFSRFENRVLAHLLSNHRLCTDKLSFKCWFAVLKQHFNDFANVALQFIKSCSLRVGTWKAWYIANVQPSIRTLFNDCCKSSHIFHLWLRLVIVTHTCANLLFYPKSPSYREIIITTLRIL